MTPGNKEDDGFENFRLGFLTLQWRLRYTIPINFNGYLNSPVGFE